MTSFIVIGSIVFVIVFFAVWLLRPDVRDRIEAPKFDVDPGPARHDRSASTGFVAIVAACGVVGAVIVGATLLVARNRSELTPQSLGTEEYGRRLLTETIAMMGPEQPAEALRHSGSRLQCGSCHLKGGTEPGTLSLVESYSKYPRFSGRDGGVRDIKFRINGCMTRSMNGRALAEDDPIMIAMADYIRVIGERYAATSESRRARPSTTKEPAAFKTPNRAADPAAGGRVFTARCAVCHGTDGHGLTAAVLGTNGVVFPPLSGPDSFNDGAGMHRVLTAARFIKAKMPLGQATLTDDEAFDVAAYINVQPRPEMANLDQDYPDRATKPVDNPYGPYADPFSLEQHRLGPFAPIEAFYAKLKGGR